MKCLEPFVKAGEVYPCGKCLPCKFSVRRIWFHRILLEASQHDYSAVVNLTYDEVAIPVDRQLDARALQLWIKRYRKRALERYPWRYLRFYAAGEYGENSQRPHYHVVLFGQPGCFAGRHGRLWCSGCECVTCQDIVETWTVGECSVQALDSRSAAYVAGYVTRKALSENLTDVSVPPFTRMSRNPGIGANAMDDVASTVLTYGLGIPSVLSHGKMRLPLGRYLRRKLSEKTGQAVEQFEPSAAMQAVRAYAFDHCRSQKSVYREINAAHASQLTQREALREKVL